MKGRIYDPKLGRFLQADPFIGDPYHGQNHNRYSYVHNNPLSRTDPSGYFVAGPDISIGIGIAAGLAEFDRARRQAALDAMGQRAWGEFLAFGDSIDNVFDDHVNLRGSGFQVGSGFPSLAFARSITVRSGPARFCADADACSAGGQWLASHSMGTMLPGGRGAVGVTRDGEGLLVLTPEGIRPAYDPTVEAWLHTHRLGEDELKFLQPLFSHLDLRKVAVSRMPVSTKLEGHAEQGMVWIARDLDLGTMDGLQTLAHELQHLEQEARLGRMSYRYGYALEWASLWRPGRRYMDIWDAHSYEREAVELEGRVNAMLTSMMNLPPEARPLSISNGL